MVKGLEWVFVLLVELLLCFCLVLVILFEMVKMVDELVDEM